MKKRYASVIGLNPDRVEVYKRLHADVWPTVLEEIKRCNIHNYSMYLKKFDDGSYYLFSYFEYGGEDFTADMKRMANDAETQRWWNFCSPCQIPLGNREQGEWWAGLEEVFHYD